MGNRIKPAQPIGYTASPCEEGGCSRACARAMLVSSLPEVGREARRGGGRGGRGSPLLFFVRFRQDRKQLGETEVVSYGQEQESNLANLRVCPPTNEMKFRPSVRQYLKKFHLVFYLLACSGFADLSLSSSFRPDRTPYPIHCWPFLPDSNGIHILHMHTCLLPMTPIAQLFP